MMVEIFGSKKFWLLFLAPLLSLVLLFWNIQQPLIEMHGFRQTQTALTAYWLGVNGFHLAYETPVAGYPWSIPFEFPIYQWVVLVFSQLSGVELDSSGRIVSIFFFVAAFFPAYRIARKLEVDCSCYLFYFILMWSVPLYLFWARTFMIETTALFFTLLAFNYFLDFLKPDFSLGSIFWFSLSLALGLLQKITTAGPALIIMGIVFSINYVKIYGINKIKFLYIVKVLLAALIPAVAAVSWAFYSDYIKAQNAFGYLLTSEALHKWNFGTVEQRLSLESWGRIIWERVFSANLAGYLGVVLLLLGSIVLRGVERSLFYILLALFILPILIFFNLHYIHNYYQAANVFYLIAAVALVLSHLHVRFFNKYTSLGVLLACIFVVMNYASYFGSYHSQASKRYEEENNSILSVSSAIRMNTAEDSAIAVYGADWSSEITYYSQRRSVSLPRWAKNSEQAWLRPESLIGELQLGALVFCNFSEKFTLSEINLHPWVNKHPYLYKFHSCYLWLPDKRSIITNSGYIQSSKIFSKEEDLKQFEPTDIGRCDGSIDVINGTSTKPTRVISVQDVLVVKGWGIFDKPKQAMGESKHIIIEREGHNYLVFDSVSSERKDVAKFLGDEVYKDAGFSATINLDTIKVGEYKISIAIKNKGSLKICKNLSQVIIIN